MTDQETVRLHISPFTPTLLPLVLGPSLSKSAHDISFQQLDTFPERNYGYVNLPPTDAKKLIAKLNGAILKGSKMKVEEARPKKRSSSRRGEDGDEDLSRAERLAKKARKTESDDKVMTGYTLPEDRKVKRGWTESQTSKVDNRTKSKKSKDKKKVKAQAPSKYSDKDELLFKTNVPDTHKDLVGDKGRKDHSTTTVVHEFRKRTAQPSFLRSDANSSHTTTEFVEGKGWIDQDGNVVEQESQQTVAKRERDAKRGGNSKRRALTIDVTLSNSPRKAKSVLQQGEDQTLPTSSSLGTKGTVTPRIAADDDETSSSGSSVTSEDSDSAESDAHSSRREPNVAAVGGSLSTPATPPKVHPLEALFKKPKAPEADNPAKPSLEVETAFSFFDQDDAVSEDELPPMPATPFTSYDLNSRGVRSAAPTPDTAHPSRFTSFDEALANHPDLNSDADEAHDEEHGTTSTISRSATKPQSEFEKRFWQERSANNRAWKASRRTALKEQRQNQNRLKAAKKRR